MKIKINWKQSLLCFIFIQAEIFAVSFLLSGIINIIIGLFLDLGPAKEFTFAFITILIDLVFRFFIFLAFFNDRKELNYIQFSLNYSIVFVLRFAISAISGYAAYTVGVGICSFGVTIASLYINSSIIMPQQVPRHVYVIIFLVSELLTLLVAFLSRITSCHMKNKVKKELHNTKST